MLRVHKRWRHSQNEHAFDCVSFMALAAPHRWVVTRDFLVDSNGTKDFSVVVDNGMCQCNGSCGPPPDVALMLKEGNDPFDEHADKMNWTMQQRQTEAWLSDRLNAVIRLQWIEDQVWETLRTGTAPFNFMSEHEQVLFMDKLRKAKINRIRTQAYAIRNAEIRTQAYAIRNAEREQNTNDAHLPPSPARARRTGA